MSHMLQPMPSSFLWSAFVHGMMAAWQKNDGRLIPRDHRGKLELTPRLVQLFAYSVADSLIHIADAQNTVVAPNPLTVTFTVCYASSCPTQHEILLIWGLGQPGCIRYVTLTNEKITVLWRSAHKHELQNRSFNMLQRVQAKHTPTYRWAYGRDAHERHWLSRILLPHWKVEGAPSPLKPSLKPMTWRDASFASNL